jgi:four helix bundle protein
MASHKRLIAWQQCHALVLEVYRATDSFPKHELYGLTSQARRAAFSAAANIVEGAARKGSNEFRRFLDIALGSINEVGYALEVAAALNYIDQARHDKLDALHKRARFFTWKLKDSMR